MSMHAGKMRNLKRGGVNLEAIANLPLSRGRVRSAVVKVEGLLVCLPRP